MHRGLPLPAALIAALALSTTAQAVPNSRTKPPAPLTPMQLRAAVYKQDSCLAHIIDREDPEWVATRGYHGSTSAAGSYGLPQADPGKKMVSAGTDWRTNPQTQLKWARTYAASRYGSTCAAWAFWQSHDYW